MKEKVYNGLELLKDIKEDILPNNIIVEVKKDNKVFCYLRIKDKDINWKQQDKFRLSMLLDDTYEYMVITRNSIIKELSKLENITDAKLSRIIKYIDGELYNI